MMTAAEILRGYQITTTSTAIGRYYAVCPKCSHTRKQANQKLKCLGITIRSDGVKIGCNHCGWKAGEFYESRSVRSGVRTDPAVLERARAEAEERQRIEAAASQSKVNWLWSQRRPIIGSIAETYLRQCRGYGGPLPDTLGFLPARGEHPPSMIAAFGMAGETSPGTLVIDDDAVRGVHLTKLKPDGSGKAGTDADKLTIGQSIGSPIMLAPANDLLGLAVAEGIEDCLSVHEATGLGAWAAGAASRLPALATALPSYLECATIMVDNDPDGRRYAGELAELVERRGIEVRSILLPEQQETA